MIDECRSAPRTSARRVALEWKRPVGLVVRPSHVLRLTFAHVVAEPRAVVARRELDAVAEPLDLLRRLQSGERVKSYEQLCDWLQEMGPGIERLVLNGLEGRNICLFRR